jgi:hypothetical protein
MTTNASLPLALIATLPLAACAQPAAPLGGETAVLYSTIGPADDDLPICPDWMCNAATVGDGLVFDELAVDGPFPMMNIANLWVSRAEMNGRPVRFRVQGDEVTVLPDKGIGVATGPEGLVLIVEHLNGAQYELRFQRTVRVKFWVAPSGDVPYHEIRVRKIRQGTENGGAVGRSPEGEFKAALCAGTPDPAEGQEVTEMAVLFEGDRYDSRTKTVKEVEAGSRWFNVACAGTAMLKMHLLRYTRAGAATKIDVRQRQAMLKTLTADYCGDGRPYTVNAHPLIFTDALGVVPSSPLDLDLLRKKGASVEAIWGPEGVVCLDVPRFVDRKEVDCSNRLVPPCGEIGDWKRRGGVLSLNPPVKGP